MDLKVLLAITELLFIRPDLFCSPGSNGLLSFDDTLQTLKLPLLRIRGCDVIIRI